MQDKAGAQPTPSGSSKSQGTTEATSKPLVSSLGNTTLSEILAQLWPGLRSEGPPHQPKDAPPAESSGTDTSATTVDIREPEPEPVFPISVRQANALLVEFSRVWIKDKDVVGSMLDELNRWVNGLSSGRS